MSPYFGISFNRVPYFFLSANTLEKDSFVFLPLFLNYSYNNPFVYWSPLIKVAFNSHVVMLILSFSCGYVICLSLSPSLDLVQLMYWQQVNLRLDLDISLVLMFEILHLSLAFKGPKHKNQFPPPIEFQANLSWAIVVVL